MDWINENIDIVRFITSFIGGAFLTMAGSITQLIGGNVLASPSTLGMNALAVVFVMLSYFIPGLSDFLGGPEWCSLILFHIGMMIFLFLLKDDRKKIMTEIWSGEGMAKVLIFGLAFNLFIGAIFSIIQFLFMAYNLDFPSGLWFGSFKQVRMDFLYFLIPLFVFCFILLKKMSLHLSLLNFGSEFAYGLNINALRIQKKAFILALYLSGVVISFFGVFSFLGLVFPHLLRQVSFFKNNMENELLFGPVICGLFLAVLDQLTYVFLIEGAEVPVGMLSGIIGTFFLMAHLVKSRGSKVLSFAK